jgi:hypothetical protein
MNVWWTKRELDIVETLTRRVRVLATEQLARIWWPELLSLRCVRRRLRPLAAAGLLARATVDILPLLAIRAPLARWTPGEAAPDLSLVAARAKRRWDQACIPHELYLATKLAANLFGSSAGRLPDMTHRDHDLLLGQVYVLYRTRRPAEAVRWVGRDARPKAGFRIKDPAAWLLGRDGQVTRIIESAGHGRPQQVERLHEYCVDYGLPYELW